MGDLPVVKLLFDRYNIGLDAVLCRESIDSAPFAITAIVQAARCNQRHVLQYLFDTMFPPGAQGQRVTAKEACDLDKDGSLTLVLKRVCGDF